MKDDGPLFVWTLIGLYLLFCAGVILTHFMLLYL